MIALPFAAKAIGSAAILSSAVLWSMAQKKKDLERLARLEAQIAFVRFVRDRIDRYLSPINEILRNCDEKMLRGVCIGCEWSECMDVNAMRLLLRSSTYYSDGGDIMDSFLSSLGSSYRENELAGCEACIKGLNDLYGRLDKLLPLERKSSSVLAFCLAAGVVIIFI